jgi:hypothetical protein
MRIRLLRPILILMPVVLSVSALRLAAANTEWGPWMPLKDGNLDGVQIAFKKFPNGDQYYKIRNTYPVAVVVHCSFIYTTLEGKSQKESGCNGTLKPGEEKAEGGWFDFAVRGVDNGSLTAKVSTAGNAGTSVLEFPGSPRDHAQPGQGDSNLPYPGSPPSNIGSQYQAGVKTTEGDGEHEATLYHWQFWKPDSQQCPAQPGSGLQVALFEEDATVSYRVSNGVTLLSTVSKNRYFLRCIPASEANKSVRWGGPLRRGFHLSPGLHTAVIGDRG